METTISRGLRTTFLLGCFAASVFGLIYMLAPEAYQNLIGAPIKQPTETAAFREFGAALLALGYGSWVAYRAKAADDVKIAVKMVIAWMVLGALVALWMLLSSELPAIYWLYFALFAGFAVANIAFYPRG
jgi:uncharacterized protein YjeT (DUF2065 family)